MNPQNNKNLILATSLSVIIMISWTWFYEKPRLEKVAIQQKIEENNKSINTESLPSVDEVKIVEKNANSTVANDENPAIKTSAITNLEEKNEVVVISKTRQEIIEKTSNERISIENKSLHGSINLKGARFDDLTLAKYFKNPDKKEEVIQEL